MPRKTRLFRCELLPYYQRESALKRAHIKEIFYETDSGVSERLQAIEITGGAGRNRTAE